MTWTSGSARSGRICKSGQRADRPNVVLASEERGAVVLSRVVRRRSKVPTERGEIPQAPATPETPLPRRPEVLDERGSDTSPFGIKTPLALTAGQLVAESSQSLIRCERAF